MSINQSPILHVTDSGITFKAHRADLVGGVDVFVDQDFNYDADDMKMMMQATSEFVSWHVLCIWGQLNGFTGYDYLDYRIQKK